MYYVLLKKILIYLILYHHQIISGKTWRRYQDLKTKQKICCWCMYSKLKYVLKMIVFRLNIHRNYFPNHFVGFKISDTRSMIVGSFFRRQCSLCCCCRSQCSLCCCCWKRHCCCCCCWMSCTGWACCTGSLNVNLII